MKLVADYKKSPDGVLRQDNYTDNGRMGGSSYKGGCKLCGKDYQYCATGSPGPEMDACEAGYCSVECEDKDKGVTSSITRANRTIHDLKKEKEERINKFNAEDRSEEPETYGTNPQDTGTFND